MTEVSGGVTYWLHPQGATITCFADGTMDCRKPDGKKKKTTATPESLQSARGHGQWYQVEPLAPQMSWDPVLTWQEIHDLTRAVDS